MTNRRPWGDQLRDTTVHKMCASALSISTDSLFTLCDFSREVWGADSGRVLSGAGRILRELEKDRLICKLGKNAYGTQVYRLTEAGVAKGSADKLSVVEPVAQTRSPPRKKLPIHPTPKRKRAVPQSQPWTDPSGAQWQANEHGLFWFDVAAQQWVRAPTP